MAGGFGENGEDMGGSDQNGNCNRDMGENGESSFDDNVSGSDGERGMLDDWLLRRGRRIEEAIASCVDSERWFLSLVPVDPGAELDPRRCVVVDAKLG